MTCLFIIKKGGHSGHCSLVNIVYIFVVLLYFSKEKTHLCYDWNGLLLQVKVYFIASERFYFLIRKSVEEKYIYMPLSLPLPGRTVSRRFNKFSVSFPMYNLIFSAVFARLQTSCLFPHKLLPGNLRE